MSDRVKAAKLINKLFDDQTIVSPDGVVSKMRKQNDSGLAIVGSDVKSLFPSLRGFETARLARRAILSSEVEF